MTFLANLPGMLAFRTRALRVQAGQRVLLWGVVCFALGFLAFVTVRNSVYADLPELSSGASEPVYSFLRLNLVQAVVYALLVYIPSIILLSNAMSGNGPGPSVSRQEYQSHGSVLLPLWGLIFLIAAPLQYFAPQFVVVGIVGISIGMCALLTLLGVYTVWAIRQLNYLSVAQALGVFAVSWFTLPVFFILTSFLFALPFFIMIPLMVLGYLWIQTRWASRAGEQASQQHLRSLMSNPKDADAHYQLGLLYLNRRNISVARGHFENALRIDPGDPDYYYHLGRCHETDGQWSRALEHYEETYRLSPEYRLGDVLREVGKAYLHTGNADKAVEFLRCFLAKRNSDPEGRYWLALALEKKGEKDEMRVQLELVMEQARSSPRFFRKENREWIYRARNKIRDIRFGILN